MKILLINPENIQKNRRVSERTPFAGLAYIATFLDKVFGDDVNIEIIEMLPQRMTTEDVIKKINEEDVNLCGITSKTYNFSFALHLAEAIKEFSSQTLILFGGPHATAVPEEVIKKSSVDAVILREGEMVFKDIVQNYLSSKHPFEDVKGVIFKSDGMVINNGYADLIDNLDELPIPDWGKYYDLNIYDRYYEQDLGKFFLMLPIFASRGCPYGCHFCQPVLTKSYRTRSLGNVLDEVEYLVDRYKVKRLYFEDSTFGLKKEMFMDFCHQYMKRGLHKTLEWGFETNVNCVDSERMKLAKESGCVYVYFGCESTSDKVLKHIGKGATKEKIQNAIEISKKAGIRKVAGSFIFGLPYETSETANETLEFIKTSRLDSININLLDVYPGTELYDMVEKGVGGISWIPEKKDKWDECGRTVVKTYVNDLDSVEKLESLFVSALQILFEKLKTNKIKFLVRIVKYVMFYSHHNPQLLKRTFKQALVAYFPRLSKNKAIIDDLPPTA